MAKQTTDTVASLAAKAALYEWFSGYSLLHEASDEDEAIARRYAALARNARQEIEYLRRTAS